MFDRTGHCHHNDRDLFGREHVLFENRFGPEQINAIALRSWWTCPYWVLTATKVIDRQPPPVRQSSSRSRVEH